MRIVLILRNVSYPLTTARTDYVIVIESVWKGEGMGGGRERDRKRQKELRPVCERVSSYVSLNVMIVFSSVCTIDDYRLGSVTSWNLDIPTVKYWQATSGISHSILACTIWRCVMPVFIYFIGYAFPAPYLWCCFFKLPCGLVRLQAAQKLAPGDSLSWYTQK